MEPTQEQIKEFWEWCGVGYEYWLNEARKILPYIDGIDCWDPPSIDLNNLFEYAVPQLEDEIGYKETFKLLIKWITGVLEDKYEAPANGLFWLIDNRALDKVREEK